MATQKPTTDEGSSALHCSTSPERMRELLVSAVNSRALEAFDGYRRAKAECERFSREKRWCVQMVKELAIHPDEARTELSIVYHDETDPRDDEDQRLIDTALEFVAAEYEKGKYDGREAVGFFRTLLGRISDDALMRFDELT